MAKKTSAAQSALPQPISIPKPIEVDQERKVFQYTKGVTDWAHRFGPQSLEAISKPCTRG